MNAFSGVLVVTYVFLFNVIITVFNNITFSTFQNSFWTFYMVETPPGEALHGVSVLLLCFSMLWPSLVVVVCGAIFLRLEMRRRRLTLCGRRDQRDPETADGHTVSSQASGVAVAGSDAAHIRPGGRMTGTGREMIAHRLPASRGQYPVDTSWPFNVVHRTLFGISILCKHNIRYLVFVFKYIYFI